MEDPSNTDVSSTKIKKVNRNSLTEHRIPDKHEVQSGKIIPNGTGTDPEQSSEMDTVREKSKLVKITKITKIKAEPKTPSKQETPPVESTAGSSTEEKFFGFDNVELSKEQIKKQETFRKILDELNASCSSTKDQPVNETRQLSEETEEEEMTVDTSHGSDTDSNQMEIDENEKATSELSGKGSHLERDKDSDVESVKSVGGRDSKMDDDISVTGIEESEPPTPKENSKSVQGDGAKVEYCGTCDAEVDDAEEGICCDGDCERWFHLRCSGLSQVEYNELSLDENAKWACSKCSGKPPQLSADAKPLLTVRKDLGQILTPSPSLKRRSVNKEGKSPRINISNPAFLKPFDFGWKRELVYRSTNDNQNRRQADIYYYTPKGKKLRSLREISDHLAGTDLTQDNFTFWKEPIGINDSEKEIIRDAKFKLVHKDSSASPAPAVKKSVTPKIAKTPKVTPKLTATVTPLDTSGAPKASASVTPRVVFKGKPPPATGPKFKVTPSKTTTPGQTQKIVISKGDAFQGNCQNIECNGNRVVVIDGPQSSNHGSEGVIEMSTRNKFKRYGLLANAKSPRKRDVKSGFSSSTSDESNSSSQESPRKTRSAHNSMEKRDVQSARRSNGLSFKSPNTLKRFPEKPKEAGMSTNEKRKHDQTKKPSKTTACPPLYQPIPADQIPFSLCPDKSNLLLSRRPSPPEIQFRPSNPSSYGCQTSSSLMSRSSSSYQTNMSNGSVFETVLIVDTASSERYIISPNPGDSPLILNNSDCSIEIVSVESLKSNKDYEGYVIPSTSNQNTVLKGRMKNIKNNSDLTKSTDISSPISLGTSSPDTSPLIIIEDDDAEDSLPPSLQRTSPPPSSSRNRSSPSLQLQHFPSPPPLVYAGGVKSSLPTSSYRQHPCFVSGSQSLDFSEERKNITETGTSRLDYRKLKKERCYMRQKAKREIFKLKKLCLKQKQLFNRRKCEEKALQVKYLRLKVLVSFLTGVLLIKG